MLGLKQADLARRADISASYLNLIEHNRRRIGGKLLVDIADILGVELAMLTEGAGATLLATLREAASDAPQAGAEMDRLDEFAGRFPGWAALLAQSRRRIDTLERTVSVLNDRMTHDPHLAEALHEMLTTVTAIRSTASILAEPGEIEPEWQDRFHRNINEDSARLAESSRALVQYLDTVDDVSNDITAPQEEVEAVLNRNDHCFDALETGASSAKEVARKESAGLSHVANQMLQASLDTYAVDAAAVPRSVVLSGLKAHGFDPFILSEKWGCSPPLAMRRIAALARSAGLPPVALTICDASGTLTHRKANDDLQFPRFGAACTMLPLYQALAQPVFPVQRLIEPSGSGLSRFIAYAYAMPTIAPRANQAPLIEAHMLAVAVEATSSQTDVIGVGVNCGICPRENCPGRREPSILSQGL